MIIFFSLPILCHESSEAEHENSHIRGDDAECEYCVQPPSQMEEVQKIEGGSTGRVEELHHFKRHYLCRYLIFTITRTFARALPRENDMLCKLFF
jgi:hypothetical protein